MSDSDFLVELEDRKSPLLFQVDRELTNSLYFINNKYTHIVIYCDICKSRFDLKWRTYRDALSKNIPYKCVSCSNKLNWQKPTYREKQREAQKSIWNDPSSECRKKISDASKKNWADPSYVDKQRIIHSDPNYLLTAKLRSASMWDSHGFRENQKKIRNTDEWKLKQSEIMRSLWKRSEYPSNVIHGLSKNLKSGPDSILERTVQTILDSMDITYVRHYVLGPYEFDLFLPDHNTLIECQGEYWHSSNRRKALDSSKSSYISEYFPNHKLVHLYERWFLNPDYVKNQIFNDHVWVNIDFEFSDCNISLLDHKQNSDNSYYSVPEEFLQSFHYAGYGRSAKKIYGAFLGDKLIAICKFAGVVRKEVATSISMKCSEVLELDRFCIHPQYQKKNFASWFMSRCVKMIDDSKIKCFVSFADSTYGHDGTIYKASNWKEVGKVCPSYHYITNDGWVINKKKLYRHAKKMGKKEAEYAEEFGYTKVFGKEKTKFILMR